MPKTRAAPVRAAIPRTILSQNNGKDWTPCAFLASAGGGLGPDVATDPDTQKALQESLRALLDIEVATLRGRKWEAADFRAFGYRRPGAHSIALDG